MYYKYYTSCILIEIEYSRLSVSTLFERVSTLHDGTVTSLRVTVPVCSVLTSSNSVLTRDVSIQSRSKYKRYSVYVTKRVLSFFPSVYWRPLVWVLWEWQYSMSERIFPGTAHRVIFTAGATSFSLSSYELWDMWQNVLGLTPTVWCLWEDETARVSSFDVSQKYPSADVVSQLVFYAAVLIFDRKGFNDVFLD